MSVLISLQNALFRRRFTILLTAWGAVSLYMAFQLAQFYSGNAAVPYALADSVIHYGGGFTRRGPFGTIVQGISSVTTLDPLIIACAIQSLLALALTCLVIDLARRLPQTSASLFLIFAPAGVMFQIYDLDAAFRKELLGFLVLAIILRAAFACTTRRLAMWLTLVVTLVPITLLTQESTLFLFPMCVMGFLLVAQFRPVERRLIAGFLALTTALGAASILAVLLSHPPDLAAIYRALPKLDGHDAVEVLAWSTQQSIEYVLNRRHASDVGVFALYLIVALVPIYLVRLTPNFSIRKGWVIAIATFAILPLFALGFDYGRWIQMSVFPLILLVSAAIAMGYASLPSHIPPAWTLLYIGTWSLPHASAQVDFGAVALWPLLAVVTLIGVTWQRWTSLRRHRDEHP